MGTVVDGDSGEGIESAQVYIEDSVIGVLTGRDGRFTLNVPGSGSYTLVAERIGYRKQSAEVEVPDGEGVVVQIAVEQHALSLCGMMVCSYPGCGSGVSVEVRDVETGVAPDGEVTLTVTSNGATDFKSGVAPSADSAYLASVRPATGFEATFDSVTATLPIKLHAGGSLGVESAFDVRIVAANYYPWEATDVWVLPRECLPPMSETLKVWLQPRQR